MIKNIIIFNIFYLVSVYLTIIHSTDDTEECPSIMPLKMLQMNKISGNWYVSAAYPEENPENCLTLRIVKANDTILKFFCTEFSVAQGWLVRDKVIAKLPDPPIAYFDLATFKLEHHDFIPYSIIGTDYHSYATFYSCFSGNTTVWILTRMQNPSDDIIEKGKNAFRRKGIEANISRRATYCEDWPL